MRAVFAIAWIKPWRALNLLGFAFTFGVGTSWGALQYEPELFASTEPFLLLFFAFYLLMPLAVRAAPGAGPARSDRRHAGVRHAAGRVPLQARC